MFPFHQKVSPRLNLATRRGEIGRDCDDGIVALVRMECVD